MMVLSREGGLICTDIDRCTGLDLRCTNQASQKAPKKEGENKLKFSVACCNPSATGRS